MSLTVPSLPNGMMVPLALAANGIDVDKRLAELRSQGLDCIGVGHKQRWMK